VRWLRAPAVDHGAEAFVNDVEGVVPADGLEIRTRYRVLPQQWRANAQVAVYLGGERIHDLGAEFTAGEGVADAAADLFDAPAIDGDFQAAGVGAVQRADGLARVSAQVCVLRRGDSGVHGQCLR
jgi:hypothetical protein